MIKKKDLVIVVVATFCLTTILFTVLPAWSGAWPYNPWWDINDDGKIDIQDLARISGAFGTTGTNISKAGLLYDSGWTSLAGMQGQTITVMHNLNITDWSNQNITVEITGRTTILDSGLQRLLGLTTQQEYPRFSFPQPI